MVEQKPNIPTTQEEVNVPETHKKPKHDSLLMSRRKFLKGAAGLGATVMFGGLLGGCGDEQQASTTEKSTTSGTDIPYASTTTLKDTTSTTKKPPTTTESETTTTTEAPTTTTTEVQVGVDKEYVSTERTLVDVTGEIGKGEFLTKPDSEVPADLQELFKSKNPGKKILYVGKANKGDKMNAVITDKVWQFQTFGDGTGQAWNFFGGIPESPWGEYPYLATMEFLDVILIPDSEDFYMRGKNPLTESEMYIRISTNNSKTRDYPSVFAFDLAKIGQDPPGAKEGHLTWKWFLTNHKLSDIIQPGDILDINFAALGHGNLSDPDNIDWEVAVDEKGVQYASRVLFTVFNEKYRAAYKELYK